MHVLRDPLLSIDFGEMRSYVREIGFDQNVLSGFVRNSPHLSVNRRMDKHTTAYSDRGTTFCSKTNESTGTTWGHLTGITWNQRAQTK